MNVCVVSRAAIFGLCGVVMLSSMACKSSSSDVSDAEVKERPANTRDFTEKELSDFLLRSNFDVYGGEVSSQYLDLDGAAPRELLVEVKCERKSCHGDFYKINGSIYFLYSLDSLERPELLTPRPISLGPSGQAQVADLDGDARQDLLLSSQTKDGARQLKVYSVLGKLLSSRFEGNLPTGAMTQSIIDLDGDGSMELVTLQKQAPSPESQQYNPYAYGGYGYGQTINPTQLDEVAVQTWEISRGSLNLKSVEDQKGLVGAFKALSEKKDVDALELAQHVIMMRHYKQDIADSAAVNKVFMDEFERLKKKGEKFTLTVAPPDPYGYPQYDAYGNVIPQDDMSSLPSYSLFLLMSAMKSSNQPDVSAWAEKSVENAMTLEEVSALLELSLATAPEDQREQFAARTLDKALNTLIDDGPSSPNFYNLTYVDPSLGTIDNVQRQFLIASFLLAPELAFKGRGDALTRFLKRSTKDVSVMQTLLPQYPFSQAVAPYLVELDFASMPSDFIYTIMNNILPTYINTANQNGGLDDEFKRKLAAALSNFMKAKPDRQNEVLYFISNYFQDEAFAPTIASLMSTLRVKFEGGRATQSDRDSLYNVSMLLPIAMPSLSTSDRKWWINYVYRQGMGYNLDSKLAEGCYDLASQTEEQIDVIFDSMESLPKESTLASMCLPYLTGVYGNTASLSDAQKERLPDVIKSRLKPGGDEYQTQQFLASLENYEGLKELKPSLWKLVTKRKGPTDTARYQSLVLLTKLGDAKALKELKKTSKKLFTDSKFRDRNPYFNDYFYADLLARQQSPEVIELTLELAENKKVIPNACVLLRDYMQSYGRTAEMSDTQKERYDKLCTGTTAGLVPEGGMIGSYGLVDVLSDGTGKAGVRSTF